MWVDDPNFDLRYHVRHLALPKPGTMRQLLDLASLIACDPFDRTRPLWQFVVVDGLRGGKSALIEKLHHTITDGEGSVKLSLQFLDFERDAARAAAARSAARPADREPPSPDSNGDVLRDLLAGSLRMPLGLLRQIKDLLSDPTGHSRRRFRRGRHRARGDEPTQRHRAGQVAAVDRALVASGGWRCSEPRSTKRAPRPSGSGGTLNTAFLTAAAEAAGRYHERMGAPVEELRASMAISTRSEGSGSNAFSLARMLVPTGDMPIAERFTWIQAAAGAARESNATASLETLAAVASTLPTSLITRLARQQAQTIDFATSNVRGAPVPLYVAGAQILAELRGRPVGRRRLQPDAAELQPQPRHGSQHRHRRSHRTRAAARVPGESVRRPDRRREPLRFSPRRGRAT